MIKFYKSKDPNNHYDISDVLIQTENDVNLEDLLDTFERFLLAISFVFKGHVQIIEDEDES